MCLHRSGERRSYYYLTISLIFIIFSSSYVLEFFSHFINKYIKINPMMGCTLQREFFPLNFSRNKYLFLTLRFSSNNSLLLFSVFSIDLSASPLWRTRWPLLDLFLQFKVFIFFRFRCWNIFFSQMGLFQVFTLF